MQRKKQKTIKLQIIFSVLILAVFLVAEFYAMINYPQQYIIIALFAVFILLCIFFIVKGIFDIQQINEEEKREQYENLIKSQKASYLLLKKYFEMINDKVDVLQETSKVPTEEIVSAQKGVAKVIINRSRENAEALMNSNDLLMEQFEEFNNRLYSINQDIVKNVKEISQENYNQTIIKQQDIISDIKDMELHINQAIMQTQQIISSQPVQLTANVEIPQQAVAVPVSIPQMAPMPNVSSVPETNNVTSFESKQNVDFENDIKMEEASPMPEEPVVEEVLPMPEEPVIEEMPPIPEEPVKEEVPPAPEMTDPNKKMDPDEIAALIANMNGGTAEEVEAPVVEEPIPEEPVKEEVPPAPEMTDPNKKLDPDEIAALIANMNGETAEEVKAPIVEEPIPEEPVKEEKPPMPDMSDPNKTMSPDEIAALIANMS
ncbi:MAG: hypothetical protein U0K86_09430 [Agathobacter sp.]|nr:hypothetical protein [Agathobacter sp.]